MPAFHFNFQISNIFRRTGNYFFRNRMLTVGLAAVILALCLAFTYASVAPASFPVNAIVKIPKDSGLSGAADILAAKGVIKSPLMFKVYAVLLGGAHNVKAGDYAFNDPESVLRIAYRTIHGVQGLSKIKVVLPEGLSAKEMAAILARNIPNFDKAGFIKEATPYEGYLFPDTYFFFQDVEPADVVQTLRDAFKAKTDSLGWDVKFSGHSKADIVTMASIVQKESYNVTDQKIIAGILWRRIDIGMPLQVDPPLTYVLGRGSLNLTVSDLATTSPYNTYKHKGLPPGPIGNPGIDAITSTLEPTLSKYLFYLSDSSGVMHYAATNDGHVANKDKYIP